MRKKLVRLHLDEQNPSIDGVIRSMPARRNGHYIVELASVVESEDVSYRLEGERVLVPRERVVFVQELRG